jgi:hypothetical protein
VVKNKRPTSVLGNFVIGIAERTGATLAREFIVGKFTRRGRNIK